MKENLTSINVILDGSGSMASLTNDTIGGFNEFLKEQQALPGEAMLSLCIFNTTCNLVHDCVPIKSVPLLNKDSYKTTGGTALLDAIGTTIDSVGKRFADMKEEDRPSKVLFLIITDGEENSSALLKQSSLNSKYKFEMLYPSIKVKEMVEHQQSKYKWQFVFIGANIDAIAGGASLGIAANNTMAFSPTSHGTKVLYKDICSSTTRYRNTGSI